MKFDVWFVRFLMDLNRQVLVGQGMASYIKFQDAQWSSHQMLHNIHAATRGGLVSEDER